MRHAISSGSLDASGPPSQPLRPNSAPVLGGFAPVRLHPGGDTPGQLVSRRSESSVPRPGERPRQPARQLGREDLAVSKVRGIVTAQANALLWGSVQCVLQTVTAALPAPLYQRARAIALCAAQPHALLFLACLVATIARAYHSRGEWATGEAVLCTAAYLVPLLFDALQHVRRQLDLYHKFSSLARDPTADGATGGPALTGRVEGLAGLRSADSCSVVIVLRNANDTPAVDLTEEPTVRLRQRGPRAGDVVALTAAHAPAAHGPRRHDAPDVSQFVSPGGVVSETPSPADPSRGPQQGPSQVAAGAAAGVQPDVRLEFELYCMGGRVALLQELAVTVAVHDEEWRLVAQLDPGARADLAEPAETTGRWLWMEAQGMRLEPAGAYDPEVPGQGGLLLRGAAGAPSTVVLRNVRLARRQWRWLSMPRALAVACNDLAMDTGKMRVYQVQEQVLAEGLMRAFSTDGVQKPPCSLPAEAEAAPTPNVQSPGGGLSAVMQSPCLLPPPSVPPLRHSQGECAAPTPVQVPTLRGQGRGRVGIAPLPQPYPHRASAHQRVGSADGAPAAGSISPAPQLPPGVRISFDGVASDAPHSEAEVVSEGHEDMLEVTVTTPRPRRYPESAEGSADSSSESESDISDEKIRNLTSGHSRPTSTQSMLFLTQRLLAMIAAGAAALLAAAGAIRSVAGASGGWTTVELLVEAPARVAIACLPFAATMLLRVLDWYNNAWLSSMVTAQNAVLRVSSTEGGGVPQAGDDLLTASPRQGRRGSRMSRDGGTLECSSGSSETELSEASLVDEGEVLGAPRRVGELNLGVYETNLAGREPPSDSLDDLGLSLDRLTHPTIDRWLIAKHMRRIVTAQPLLLPKKELWRGRYDLVYSRNAAQVLGSLTTLCCVNKAGILADVVPVPEVVLVMKKKPPPPEEPEGVPQGVSGATSAAAGGTDDSCTGPRHPSGGGAGSHDVHVNRTVTEDWLEHPMNDEDGHLREGREQRQYHEMAFLSLDLLPDPTSSTLLHFADPDWTQHLSKLKPLGLTAALHCLQHLEEEVETTEGSRPQRRRRRRHGRHWVPQRSSRDHSEHMRAQLHYDDTILWGKYLYFLAREIGFSEQLLNAAGYRVLKRIHTLRPTDAKGPRANAAEIYTSKQCYDATLDGRQQIASLIVVDPEGEWQLLSIGNPQFLLEYTKEYWDGEDVCDLSMNDRTELLYLSNDWRRQRDLVTIAFAFRPVPEHYKLHLQRMMAQGDGKNTVHVLETEGEAKALRATLNSGLGGGAGRFSRFSSAAMSSAAATSGVEDNQSDSSEADLRKADADQVYLGLQRGQIFLGMVGLRFPPKHMVQGIITGFREAGIRFMHFNRDNERMTKAFGERLGVWTTANDWNCCISLRSHGVALDPRDIKARLPHGIEAIRRHVVETDNVPLIVPLFCDARPVSTRKMMDVLREYHEVVGCIGSCLTHDNAYSFLHADMGIAAMPTCNTKLMHKNRALAASRLTLFGLPGCPVAKELTGESAHQAASAFAESLHTLFQLGSLVSLPAAITLPPTEYPLYFVLCLIKQARMLLHTTLKVVETAVSWNLCLALSCFVCTLAACPPPLTLGQTFLHIFLLQPLLAMALHQPFEDLLCKRVMSIHPNKNDRNTHIRIIRHLAKWWAVRYPPTAAASVAVFVLTLSEVSGEPLTAQLPPSKETLQRSAYRNALQFSQQGFMVASMFFYGMHALGSLSRHQSMHLFQMKQKENARIPVPKRATMRLVYQQKRKQLGSSNVKQEWYNPLEWPSCVLQILAVFLLQLAFSVGSVVIWRPDPNLPALGPGDVPSAAWLVLAVYSLCILLLDNVWKKKRRESYFKEQTWRKIHFDTQLGMHSPCGYDREDEDKGPLKQAQTGPEILWAARPFYSI